GHGSHRSSALAGDRLVPGDLAGLGRRRDRLFLLLRKVARGQREEGGKQRGDDELSHGAEHKKAPAACNRGGLENTCWRQAQFAAGSARITTSPGWMRAPGARVSSSMSAIVWDGSMEEGLTSATRRPPRWMRSLVWGVKPVLLPAPMTTNPQSLSTAVTTDCMAFERKRWLRLDSRVDRLAIVPRL